MLEVALLVVSCVLALVGTGWAARVVPDDGLPAETARGTRQLRDDAIVGTAASVLLFVAVAIGHQRHGALTFAAWSAGAVALGALATMGARAWHDRMPSSRRAAVLGERVIVITALGALTVLGAAAAHALGDPQHLATQVPEMVVAFTVGSVALGAEVDGSAEGGTSRTRGVSIALPAAASMVLASYFFDANAGALRSGPSYASALGFVLFPLAATALGTMGSAIALGLRRASIAAVLTIPAVAAAAIAMLGWLWQPFALCGAVGASMTLVPKLTRMEGRPKETLALVSLAAAAIGSYVIARHTGLEHAGFFGVAVAAMSAESAAIGDDEPEGLADRQAAALSGFAVAMAVLDGAVLFRCTRFAELAGAPTGDIASMLAHCTLANVAPARIDISHPMVLVCAVFGVAMCAGVPRDITLRDRVIALATVVGALALTAAFAHFAFGVGAEAIGAATLAALLASALFPATCSRNVARVIAACALALGAVIG
jgi:hypothetical protein